MGSLSTDQIIVLVRQGEVDAFGDLVHRYQGEVWKVVSAMLRETKLTEDIVQQAFVDAYFHLGQFQDGRDFLLWLKEIARNRVRMELRRTQREGVRLMTYHAALLNEPDFHDQERESHMREMLLHCCAQLPPHTAELVRQRYTVGRSFEDIATELGRSIEAVRQTLSRARVALRDCVRHQITEPL